MHILLNHQVATHWRTLIRDDNRLGWVIYSLPTLSKTIYPITHSVTHRIFMKKYPSIFFFILVFIDGYSPILLLLFLNFNNKSLNINLDKILIL